MPAKQVPVKVPEWIGLRLKQYAKKHPHYEASLYGPIDKLANTLFSDQRFMVKPQSKLQVTVKPPVEQDNSNDAENQRTSIDSMRTPVNKIPRKYKEPDFVIVQVSTDGNEVKDIPLLCIEAKVNLVPGTMEFCDAEYQISEYLSMFVSKNPHSNFRGVLVGADRFYFYALTGNTLPGQAHSRRIGTPNGLGFNTAADLTKQLKELAAKFQ